MYSKLRFNFGLCIAVALASSICALADEEVSVTDAPVRRDNIQLTIMTNYRQTQGSFDPYGTYNAYPAGSDAWSAIQVYSVSYRFDSPFELGLSFASRRSESTFPTGSSESTAFGSPSISGRYHLAVNRETHVIFHGAFGTPFKMSSHEIGGDPTASMSADGDLSAPVGAPMGGYTLRGGAGISRSFRAIPIHISFDANVTYSFQSTGPVMDGPDDGLTQTVHRGNQYSLNEGAGYSLSRYWMLSGSLMQAWSADTVTDDQDMQGTASRLMSTSLGLTYLAKEDWRLTASYNTQWPFYAYIVNQPYAPSMTVGFTYTGI
jgi:hypothetical protein